MFKKYILFYFIHLIINTYGYEYTVVNTKLGKIRGIKNLKSNYTSFLGIPYAKVNLSNPFGKSTSIKKYDGIYDATRENGLCSQKDTLTFTIKGHIDCLHLNIFTPINNKNKLPVLVYIYGGKYIAGDSSRQAYDPQYLIRYDIILVVMSYRVGPYGFLCLDTPEIPGNQGVKDQLSALRWVKDNIQYFGGDPDRITLGGHSSGAHNVDSILLSTEKPLYQQVMLLGGNSYFSDIWKPANKSVLFALTKEIGYETDDLNEALTFLAELEPSIVVSASVKLNIEYGLCVEKQFENVENIIKDHPINQDVVPQVNNMNIWMSQTDDEMIYLFKRGDLEVNENIITKLIKLSFDFDEEKLNKVVNLTRKFYIEGVGLNKDTEYGLGEILTDVYISHPYLRSIRKYMNNGANIYYSIFSYLGNLNLMKNEVGMDLNEGGAIHADELGYIFKLTDEVNDEDQKMIDVWTTLVTNFVKFGNPTPKTSDLIPIIWPSIKNTTITYCRIDKELSLDKNPWSKRMTFWDLFFELGSNYVKYRKDRTVPFY